MLKAIFAALLSGAPDIYKKKVENDVSKRTIFSKLLAIILIPLLVYMIFSTLPCVYIAQNANEYSECVSDSGDVLKSVIAEVKDE